MVKLTTLPRPHSIFKEMTRFTVRYGDRIEQFETQTERAVFSCNRTEFDRIARPFGISEYEQFILRHPDTSEIVYHGDAIEEGSEYFLEFLVKPYVPYRITFEKSTLIMARPANYTQKDFLREIAFCLRVSPDTITIREDRREPGDEVHATVTLLGPTDVKHKAD